MRWYEQAGTPEISFDEHYDAAAKTFTLTLRQHTKPTPCQPEKKPFLIPVAMGLLGGDGEELHSETLILDTAEKTFTFTDIKDPPTPSLFREFSAPIKLKGQSRDRLAFLAAHDTDLFNRWDALQQYATLTLLDDIAAYQAGKPYTLDPGLRDAIAAILKDARLDPAFAAVAILLPTESLLADEMETADPDAIAEVRQAAIAALGTALHAAFLAAYETFGHADPADVSGTAMAHRALKNAALAYLTTAGDTSLAATQYAQAANMTGTLAALANLTKTSDIHRDNALAAFHAKWQHNALVLDKWFALQAIATAPDTLARVQTLTQHPDFDMRNPNRVRSLIAYFTGNQQKFNDKSGAGYKILSDAIIALDPKNPQLAARLCSTFGNWRRFDAQRQGLMRAEIERILATANLSANTFEMASRALA
jgi:aminopeptidase N